MVEVNLNHLQKDLLLPEDLNKNVTSAEDVFSHPVICNNERNTETNNNENYEDKGVEMDGTYLKMNINSEQVNQESSYHKNEYNDNSNNTNDYNNSINDNNNNDIIAPTLLNIFKYESLCNAFHNDFNGCVDTDAWNQNSNNISCSGLNSYVFSEYSTEPLSCDVQNNIIPVFFNGLECEKDKYGDMKDNKLNDEYVNNGLNEVTCKVRNTGHCTKPFECVENSYLESFKAFIEELKNVDTEADEIASVSSISEHCSGYQSSDFEFIDEAEAKEAMFVTKGISSIETLAENINSDFKFNDKSEAKMKVFHTNEIHTMENREETNSYNPNAENAISFNNLEASSTRSFMYNRNNIHNTTYRGNLFDTHHIPTMNSREVTNSFNPHAQNAISFNYLKASSSRNFMYNRNTFDNTAYQENANYQQNHVIPEGEDFLNLFQGAHVPAYESRFFENKSIFARNPTSTVKHIGFDISMLLEGHKQYISENDGEYRIRTLPLPLQPIQVHC
ncbi:unnamed protein product [Parnassius apollo]|uniref:(apollo) hypothetical protein n=1 Tax=Parnassius apollo TaxID=110799 RepID=A0A8S3Y2P1_PARAO|nr:unnamed protein product [Parnassius apollo]